MKNFGAQNKKFCGNGFRNDNVIKRSFQKRNISFKQFSYTVVTSTKCFNFCFLGTARTLTFMRQHLQLIYHEVTFRVFDHNSPLLSYSLYCSLHASIIQRLKGYNEYLCSCIQQISLLLFVSFAISTQSLHRSLIALSSIQVAGLR